MAVMKMSEQIVQIEKQTWSNILKTSRSALSDIKHSAIALCFISNKARTASDFSFVFPQELLMSFLRLF